MANLLAYLDPGTGSLLLQALIGGFAGIWVFFRYFWQRWTSRRKVSEQTKTTCESDQPESHDR